MYMYDVSDFRFWNSRISRDARQGRICKKRKGCMIFRPTTNEQTNPSPATHPRERWSTAKEKGSQCQLVKGHKTPEPVATT